MSVRKNTLHKLLMIVAGISVMACQKETAYRLPQKSDTQNQSGTGPVSTMPVATPTASPSPTSTPVMTPTPSPSPTMSPSPTASPSPTVSPKPTPTPTPSPSSTPPPTPTPSPTPTPVVGASCQLSSMPDHGDCPRESSRFLQVVESALDQVISQHPEYFDLNDQISTGSPRIVNGAGYLYALSQALIARGFCVNPDTSEEVAIKVTNSFNEQFDVYTSTGYVRRGKGAYRSTCYPAAF